MKVKSLSSMEVEELACKITGLDYDEIHANEAVIDETLQNEFNINLDDFARIVSFLLPLIDVGNSPLTGTRFKGFSDVEKQMWLVKMEIPKPKV